MSIAMNANQPYVEHEPKAPHQEPGTRLKQDGLSDGERNVSIFMHLLPLILAPIGAGPFAFLGPLVLWAIQKDKSAFNDDHGREVMNFMISMVLLSIILCITIIGIPFILVLWIMGIVNMIRGAIAASNGEYFRYPFTWRFIS
ncbi:MAG: DUF4870 domain-containing protein [Planctomycetota bacterium]|nr:DUF4870 domain-containing protein [Planctomycetota bacterium]